MIASAAMRRHFYSSIGLSIVSAARDLACRAAQGEGRRRPDE